MSKVKNTMLDLNNHLFEQMERLNDDDLEGDALQQEIDRAKAMEGIASQIVANAKVTLEIAKTADTFYDRQPKIPRMLLGVDDDA